MVAQVASVTKEKAVPQTPASPMRSMIVKTAAVSAVPPATVTASYPKPEGKDRGKQVKKALSTE